jgi:hypothetical protein
VDPGASFEIPGTTGGESIVEIKSFKIFFDIISSILMVFEVCVYVGNLSAKGKPHL